MLLQEKEKDRTRKEMKRNVKEMTVKNNRREWKREKKRLDWASEHGAIPVVRKGGNISLSLHISCAGWDAKQLMAFAAISYLHSPRHSHLDPSPTEHFFTLVAKHSCSPSLIRVMMKHSTSPSLFNLFLHIHPTLLYQWIMNHGPSIRMNSGHLCWKNTDRRYKATDVCVNVTFLSFWLSFINE